MAKYTRRLHQQGFVHWDLKWRNILVQDNPHPQVYFFDCPLGRQRFAWLRKRGSIKDLARLDIFGKSILSRTQRLKFYLLYTNRSHLDTKQKKQINKILTFYKK